MTTTPDIEAVNELRRLMEGAMGADLDVANLVKGLHSGAWHGTALLVEGLPAILTTITALQARVTEAEGASMNAAAVAADLEELLDARTAQLTASQAEVARWIDAYDSAEKSIATLVANLAERNKTIASVVQFLRDQDGYGEWAEAADSIERVWGAA